MSKLDLVTAVSGF